MRQIGWLLALACAMVGSGWTSSRGDGPPTIPSAPASAPVPTSATPRPAKPAVDPPVRRIQATAPTTPAASMPAPTTLTSDLAGLGGRSIALQAALYGALTSNPDLVTLRQGAAATTASPESVEVARHFPTTLNPTVWLDYRPITLIPADTFANQTGSKQKGFYENGQGYFYVSVRQPIEFGHQTTHRYHIAQAAYNQQQWLVIQSELTTLVQTYRFFQTAAYRREKLHVAQRLSEFNDRLLASLQRRLEASQALPVDVTLARVESRAVHQQIKAARQDYLTALTDLRNQLGQPESAGTIEPLGEFTMESNIPQIDEASLIQLALQNRPDIHTAQAQVAGTAAAVQLARADRIPPAIVGPQYEMDEAGVQYIGFIYAQAIPILNSGKPLVRQREAEHRRACVALQEAQLRAQSQVRAAVAKWNGAADLMNESSGLSKELNEDVATMERLFEAGQADLTKLMQARQRLIQLENARLDSIWAATQAQSDLLLALGVPSLLTSAVNKAEADARVGPVPATTPATPAPPTAPAPAPSPFAPR